MVLVQVDVPDGIDKMLQIERIRKENITKAETIVEILKEYFEDEKEETTCYEQ